MIYVITVAFCPAAQLARALMCYQKVRGCESAQQVVIQGHYPINRQKNNRDIAMICKGFGIELLDPGSDLGSAQSQNWALEKLEAREGDIFINLDPDSACNVQSWDMRLIAGLTNYDECAAISLWSEQWDMFRERVIDLPSPNCLNIARAIRPTPFNLSAFRVGFIQQTGGLRQVGEKWGDLEAYIHAQCERLGMWHGYLMNIREDLSGKYMQDAQLLEYKDAYMRTPLPNNFTGTYEEYLKWKYPELLKSDTFIPEGTEFK